MKGKRLLLVTRLMLLVVLLSLATACTSTSSSTSTAVSSSATSSASTTTTLSVKPSSSATAPMTTATTTTVAPKPTGDLNIALGSLGEETFDPMFALSSTNAYQMRPMYDFFVGYDAEKGQLSKDVGIAKDWTMSPDGLTWTFKLRQGVKFHNGDDLTSADVKFSLDRVMSTASKNPAATTLRSTIKSVEAPDAYTIVISLKTPYAFLANLMSGSTGGVTQGFVLPMNYINKVGDSGFAARPVGSGPYQFAEAKPGSYIKLKAVDYPHWRIGIPKYQNLTLQVVPEESTRIAMLKTNATDGAVLSPENAPQVKSAGLNVFNWPGSGSVWIVFLEMWKPENPLSNASVRAALQMAINKQELVDTIFSGSAQVSRSPIGPAGIGYDPALDAQPNPYDPIKAKQLLADAGYANAELKVYDYEYPGFPTGVTMMQALAGYWSKIGIKVNLINVDYATFKTQMAAQNTGGAIAYYWAATPLRPGPMTAMYTSYDSKGSAVKLKDPKMDQLIEAAMSAVTLDDIAVKAKPVYRAVYDNVYQIDVCRTASTVGANPAKIKAWPMSLSENDLNLEALYRR